MKKTILYSLAALVGKMLFYAQNGNKIHMYFPLFPDPHYGARGTNRSRSRGMGSSLVFPGKTLYSIFTYTKYSSLRKLKWRISLYRTVNCVRCNQKSSTLENNQEKNVKPIFKGNWKRFTQSRLLKVLAPARLVKTCHVIGESSEINKVGRKQEVWKSVYV